MSPEFSRLFFLLLLGVPMAFLAGPRGGCQQDRHSHLTSITNDIPLSLFLYLRALNRKIYKKKP